MHLNQAPHAPSNDDERGVTLYIALPVALLMIVAAWSILAFGDTMWVRHRGQETADAAALASAVSHAQALNLIAALNAAMLAMTVIYLVSRVLVDVMNLVLGVGSRPFELKPKREDLSLTRFGVVGMLQSWSNLSVGFPAEDADPLGVAGEVPIVGGLVNSALQPYGHDRNPLKSCVVKDVAAGLLSGGTAAHFCDTAKPVAAAFWFLTGNKKLALSRTGVLPLYEKFVLGSALQGMNDMSRTLAKVAPLAGVAQAMSIARDIEKKDPKHKLWATALSSSMLPASTWQEKAKAPMGLPLGFDHARRLCDKAATEMGVKMQEGLASTPGLSGIAKGKVGEGLKKVGNWIGDGAASRYCDDKALRYTTGPAGATELKIWREERDGVPRGPAYIDRALSNGHAAFATYGIASVESTTGFHQDTLTRMHIARFLPSMAARAESNIEATFVARAEFYFGCSASEPGKATWKSEECNASDDAMYRMNWRARLRGMQDKGPIDTLLAKISLPILTKGVNTWREQMHH